MALSYGRRRSRARRSLNFSDGGAYTEEVVRTGLKRGAIGMDAFIYTFERLLCGLGELEDALEKALRPNTVQRRITTASEKVFFKGGRWRCSGRFFFHFDIFRLITRGLIRLRRGSVRSVCISQSTPRYHASNDAGALLSHSGSRHFRI